LQQFLGFANYYNSEAPGSRGAAETSTTSAPVLILPDPERDYVIEADASDQAVGAVLMQDQGNGLEPIAYLSKKLHGAETNYVIHDKEALAIVIAFKAWRCYLEGQRTTVYTDHCSLKYLKTQPNLSRRQVLWIDFLETHFHYDIVYKPGHKNKADALSRPAHQAEKRRDYCSLFLSQNNHGKWLAWTSSPGYHLPPAVMTPSLSSLTSSPKWDTSSRHTRRHAPRRQHNSSFVTSSHSMASQPYSSPTETPSSPASSGRNLCLFGTKLAMSSAYHPQTDGQTERLNQIVEQLLRAACKDEISKWDLHLPVLEFAYNNATHAATGQTPFFLCYGRHPLTPQKPTHPLQSTCT
ncbi:hypothetical protein CLOM_g5321, partial [Closterium sp. NIES-68]